MLGISNIGKAYIKFVAISQVYECQNIQHEFTLSELYEGLKLAQRGRLEDQRGTEIKFEMPDFLKREQQQVYTALS